MGRFGKRVGLGMLVAVVVAVIIVALVPVVQPEYAAAASAPSKTVVVKRAASGKLTMKKGGTYLLGARAQGMKGAALSYASSNPSVAKVAKGRVRALSAGKAAITVTAQKGKAKAKKKVVVTVVAPREFKKVKALSVGAKTTSLVVGDSVRMKTTFKPARASNKNVLFQSSDSSIAEVNAKGQVTAKKEGFVKITATSAENANMKRALYFTVVRKTSDTIPVITIAAGAERQELFVGESEQVETFVLPANASNREVAFSSTDDNVLTVSSAGVVTARGVGSAYVIVRSVSDGRVIRTVLFTVKPLPEPAEPEPPAKPVPPYDDEEVIAPEAVDSEHDNVIEYGDGVKFFSGSGWTVASDGSVAFEGGSAPAGLAAGDIVVFGPTDEHPSGYALKVAGDSDHADEGGGVLAGSQPDMGELFDRVDVEMAGGVGADGFAPAAGVEVVSAETIDLEGRASRAVREVRPEGSSVGAGAGAGSAGAAGAAGAGAGSGSAGAGAAGAGAGAAGAGLGSAGAELLVAGVPMGLSRAADELSGKTTKFTLRAGDLTFGISPNVTTKIDMQQGAVRELYLAVALDESVAADVEASDLFAARDSEMDLGRLTFATGVPGMSIAADLHAKVSSDGVMTFSIGGASTLGVSYRDGSFKMVAKAEASDISVASRQDVSARLNVSPELGFWGVPMAEAALSGEFKLGSAGSAKVTAGPTICSDYQLTYGADVAVGEGGDAAAGEGGMFDMSWKKALSSDVNLRKWHMENGRFVNVCSAGAAGAAGAVGATRYDDCSGLVVAGPATPLVASTVERDFSLPTDRSVVWVPFTLETENSGVEVSITDPADGRFDAFLSYGVFTEPNDDAECIAEKGISRAATYAFSKDDMALFGLSEATTYYLRLTNACYVNPYYYPVSYTNKNELHLELKVMNNDVNEGNDDYVCATQLGRGAGTMFRLFGKADADVFCFEAPSAGKVNVSIWGDNDRFDTRIGYTVFSVDEDGTVNEIGELGVSDYARGVFNTATSRMFDVPEAGVYYVKVANAYTWNRYYYSTDADNKTPLYIAYDFA